MRGEAGAPRGSARGYRTLRQRPTPPTPSANEHLESSTLPSGGEHGHRHVVQRPRPSSHKTWFTTQVVLAQLWPRRARLPTAGPAEGQERKTEVSPSLRGFSRNRRKLPHCHESLCIGPWYFVEHNTFIQDNARADPSVLSSLPSREGGPAPVPQEGRLHSLCSRWPVLGFAHRTENAGRPHRSNRPD